MQSYLYSTKSFSKRFTIFLLLLFNYFGNAQGNTCATAEVLTIDGTCDTSTSLTQTINTAVCGGTNWRRVGFYTFTVSSGPQNITITADSGNRNLVLGLFSGTCATPTNLQCADAITTNGAQTEAITANLNNGTYIIAVGNTTNNNMTLNSICVTSGPSTNFTCATATTLPCGTTSLAGTTVGSPGTPAHGSGCTMSNYGAWYTFVGDGQQTTISSTAGAGFDHEMSISSGSCGSLTNIACNDSGLSGGTESYTFIATAGVTYYVYIAYWSSTGTSTDTGTFTISRTCTPIVSPPNDNCGGAVALTVNPDLNCGATTSGSLSFATDSGVTGSGCGGTDDDDVWYSFVATSTVHHVELLNVAGSTTDLYHAVYSGTCGTLGAALVCSDPNSSIVTGLTIGNTYFIQVYSWTSTTGQNTTFDVCVGTPPPPPGNDNCAGAIALTVNPDTLCGVTTAGSIASATDSGVAGSGCGGTDDDDVWYSFVATNTTHFVSLLNVTGSTTDMYHAVYSGASGCVSLGVALVCSDANNSTVTGLTIGQTYYVQVYTWTSTGGQTSSFDICIGTPPPAPGNDNCSGAIALTVNPDVSCSITTAGSIASATDSGVAASGCGGTDDDDVWYSFVATNSTHYVSLLNVTGSTTDMYHAVYSGASGCGSLGAALVCSDADNSTVSGLTVGQTYYVQVYTWTSTGGQTSSFDICIGTPCNGSGPGTGTTTLGCPSVISGGLGLNGADHAPIICTAASTCVDIEATYLDLGDTSTYRVESIPYNPPYQFECLANPVSVNTDDVWSPAINLPFDFCFFGNTYNQCTIGSNGILSFDMANAGTGSGYSFSNNLPSTVGALFANSIYGVYHDIDPGAGGEVGWELITLNTGCRALVASWHDVPMFSNNSILYTGMMVLYENTNVIEVYIENKEIDGTWNGGNAIVGIQDAAGTTAVVAPGRNGLDPDWTTTNEAWRFVPDGTSIASLTWYEGSGTSGPVLGTTPVINVCPTSTTTYTAAITYTLCDGSTLTETEETTVTINGSKVWNGSVNTDWDNDNNWTPVGKPTALDCVVIPDTANDPIISGTGYNGLGLNLSIQNDAVLSVNTDNSVTITDWVNISTTGELFLDNAASLIQTNNIANIGAGAMHMERDVNIRRLDYVYWSSPVTNFASSAISPNTPTGLIWKWTPTVSGNGTGNSGDWVNGNENMTVGKGYIVRGPSTFNTTLQNFTATFVGTPNNGNISIPITRGNYTAGATYQVCATCTPATNLDDNWNLVGNPYPSAIDAIDFLTANPSIDGYIKIWTHGTLPTSAIADPFYEDFVYNYTIGDYITYNSSGSSSGPGVFNGYIAAGQGFFVSMLDGGPATKNLNFTNSLRSNTYDNGQFFRNANVEKNRIWLDIIDGQNRSTRTLVGYIDGATNETDRLFDAKTDNKIDLNLFSLIENETYMIQGKALPFNDNDVIPLGFKVPSNGIYTIAIGALDGIFENTNQNIYLEDKELNIIYNLREAQYSFIANEGTNSNRFNLIFKNVTNNDPIDTENTVWVSTENSLTIHSNIQNIKSVRVFDLLGRILTNKENINGKTITLDKVIKNNTGLILEIVLENNQTLFKKTIY